MALPKLHKFSKDGKFFVIDPQHTFCFECDEITYDIVGYYPDANINTVISILSNKYSESEIKEVWGELEFLRVTGLILKQDKLESWAKELTSPLPLNTLILCIDESLASDDAKLKFISKSLLKAFPQFKDKSKINLQLLFLSDFVSIDGCKDIINSEKEIFASPGNDNLSVTYVFPLPSELAENRKLSTDDKVFILIPAEDIENTRYKIEIYPAELDITSLVKKVIDMDITEIKIHFESLFTSKGNFTIRDIFNHIDELTDLYVQILKTGNRIVISPIVDIFTRIQKGIPSKLSDPSGIQQWFITTSGEIYGGYLYYLNKIGKIGNINNSEPPDKEALSLLNRGVDINPACINCWAKHLCGGGNPITHFQFTKKFNSPHQEWCDFQRDWIESIIAKFQELGDIDFSTLAKSQTHQKEVKTGKLTTLKHIFQRFFSDKLYIRPLKPQDDTILARWENWNTATYYTFFESSVLTTNAFEKEREILDTQRDYEIYLIVDLKNNPRGLMRIKPTKPPNTFYVWLYFHHPEDYESKSVINNFQEIISHLRGISPAGRFLFPSVNEDEKLSNFLQKCGMNKLGTLREAVFYHNSYHDIEIFTA